jgi:hypothetical protein
MGFNESLKEGRLIVLVAVLPFASRSGIVEPVQGSTKRGHFMRDRKPAKKIGRSQEVQFRVGILRCVGHFDPEILIAIAVFCSIAIIGLATVQDYGITVDEWNADDYGPKALAWYTSAFSDRSMFEDVEDTLWYYGPWFQILTSFVQALGIVEHWTARHGMTFLAGLAATAMLLPLARRVAGRWSGLAAIMLCLTTGYFYGSIFFTPIDVPFALAMTAATLAIVTMAEGNVPSWPATVAAGLLIGLAIATRSSGAIAYAYLIGAMALCALDAILSGGRSVRQALAKIGMRTLAAGLLAWLTAIVLWPWLQIANPFTQFAMAFTYFANHPKDTEVVHWGKVFRSNHLPWSYIPEQLAARLPGGFLLLLVVGLLCGLAGGLALIGGASADRRQEGPKERLKAVCLAVAQSRQTLVVWAAALLPIAFVIVQGSTLYDGIRHVFFLIPILAVIAATGFVRLLPILRRFPVASATVIAAYLGYQAYLLVALHPLQYVAFNALAGGVQGAYQRFDMDYWSVGATVALRRLEARLDREATNRFKDNPPSLMICITWRENMVEPMYRRPWRLETVRAKADYLIATERFKCADNLNVDLIDEVKRLDRAFAWTYAARPRPATASPSAAPAQR